MWDDFMADERGMGTIEVVLILVVLVGLVLIFKDKIRSLLNSVFGQIETQSQQVWTNPNP